MEGGALFNPGFLGGSFLWWVGQVADQSVWKENVKDSKHKGSGEIPGWGYRYKVRIIGLHDQGEAIIPSDQLPWAQVMYPVTSGGGQGKSYQTPGIKQGNFVFGFFLDGQDQQIPVIMGILGANAQVPKSTQTGATEGQNFTSQSGGADKVADDDLVTERPSGVTPDGQPTGGDDPNNPPAENIPPTKESPAAPHQKTAADERKDEVLKKKHPIWCTDPRQTSPMKGIQTLIEELTKKIQKLQSGLESYTRAISSKINIVNSLINQVNEIDALIKNFSCEIAKFLRAMIALVQDFVTDLFTRVLQPIFNISPPTIRIEILDKLVKGLELIECLFNKIGLSLCDLTEKSLKNSFARRAQGRPAPASVQPFLTDQYANIPWFADVDGGDEISSRYNPTPLCYAEEIVGEILGENLNDIINTFDAAVLPIVKDVETALNDVSAAGSAAAGKVGVRPRNQSSAGDGPLLPNIPDLPSLPSIPSLGSLGALGGGGFDIASALSFISALTSFFDCDLSLICSPNEYHTLQEGGNATPSEDEASNVEIAKTAQRTAEKPPGVTNDGLDNLSTEQLKGRLDPTVTGASNPAVFNAASQARQDARNSGASPEEVERRVLVATVRATKQPKPAPAPSPTYDKPQ